jgi:hypothetical protein
MFAAGIFAGRILDDRAMTLLGRVEGDMLAGVIIATVIAIPFCIIFFFIGWAVGDRSIRRQEEGLAVPVLPWIEPPPITPNKRIQGHIIRGLIWKVRDE